MRKPTCQLKQQRQQVSNSGRQHISSLYSHSLKESTAKRAHVLLWTQLLQRAACVHAHKCFLDTKHQRWHRFFFPCHSGLESSINLGQWYRFDVCTRMDGADNRSTFAWSIWACCFDFISRPNGSSSVQISQDIPSPLISICMLHKQTGHQRMLRRVRKRMCKMQKPVGHRTAHLPGFSLPCLITVRFTKSKITQTYVHSVVGTLLFFLRIVIPALCGFWVVTLAPN